MRIALALLVTAMMAPAPVQATPAEIALAFATDFAIPRFTAVAAAAHAQETAWSNYCAHRDNADPATLKASFNTLADAWAKIEFVRIGPAAVALRAERFNWWLDRTNATGKALALMLASDPATLTPEKLAAGSVAGQGLPILERLLYDPNIDSTFRSSGDAVNCAVGEAVARGQSSIADTIVADWTSADGARAALAANTRWKMSFADANEAASVMLTDLVAGLETLKDLKVAMLFHDMSNVGAPRLSEAVRSERTVRDIELNLVAIRDGLDRFMATATPAQKLQMNTAFDDAQRTLADVERTQKNHKAKPEARLAAVRVTLAAFSTLAQTAMSVAPVATGLTLGFNSLDGD